MHKCMWACGCVHIIDKDSYNSENICYFCIFKLGDPICYTSKSTHFLQILWLCYSLELNNNKYLKLFKRCPIILGVITIEGGNHEWIEIHRWSQCPRGQRWSFTTELSSPQGQRGELELTHTEELALMSLPTLEDSYYSLQHLQWHHSWPWRQQVLTSAPSSCRLCDSKPHTATLAHQGQRSSSPGSGWSGFCIWWEPNQGLHKSQ